MQWRYVLRRNFCDGFKQPSTQQISSLRSRLDTIQNKNPTQKQRQKAVDEGRQTAPPKRSHDTTTKMSTSRQRPYTKTEEFEGGMDFMANVKTAAKKEFPLAAKASKLHPYVTRMLGETHAQEYVRAVKHFI